MEKCSLERRKSENISSNHSTSPQDSHIVKNSEQIEFPNWEFYI